MKTVASENSKLTSAVESLKSDQRRLIIELENSFKDTASKNDSINLLEQDLAVQASLFDSKISDMQEELDSRLDEIQASRNVDVESVKAEYITLFDEKATELHKLRSEFESQSLELERTRKLLADQQYQSHEFQQQVKHERSCHHTKLEESVQKVTGDLEAFRHCEYAQLEAELSKLRHRYDKLQLSYLNAITTFKTAMERGAGDVVSSATTCDSFIFTEDASAQSCCAQEIVTNVYKRALVPQNF